MTTQIAHKLTVEEYERLEEIGEDDRTELIDGEVVFMSPIGDRHAACVRRLDAFLYRLVRQTATISSQQPVRLSDLDRPQPDVAVLRWREDDYAYDTPTSADVLLLVEVADSTLAEDRRTKLPLYARA